MKNFFVLVLSFVFVVQINGQGYIGRRQEKRPIKPVIGHPVMPKPLKVAGFDSSLGGLHGGGVRAAEPRWRNRHVGNGIHGGAAILGRQTGFPMHGDVIGNHAFQGGLMGGLGHNPRFPMSATGVGAGTGYIGRQRKPAKATIIGGHDPLAVRGGHRIVKNVLNDAAHTIDAGSHGALSRGDPFAHQAAEGLAREMVHVAGKELGVAPKGVRPFGQGMLHQPIHPVHQQIHPKPVLKPVNPKPFIPVHHPIQRKPIQKPIHPKPIGQIHKPIHPKPIHPKPIGPEPHHRQPFGILRGGLRHLQGGGRLPPSVRNIIGSTINGEMIIGGQNGFPRHGGAGVGESFKDGLRNGWGSDPNAAVHQAVSSWVDPLEGRMFPNQYAGEDLMYDDDAGHYVIKSQAGIGGAGGHHIAKASGIAPIGQGIGPIGGHQIAKASGIAPIGGHHMAKASGIAPIGGHHMAKASGIAPIGQGIGPIGGHHMAKASGIAPIGGHHMAKASGIAPIGGHHMAKASGIAPIGQGIGPIGGHHMAKASGIAPIGGHHMAKASGIAPIGQGIGHIDQGFGPGFGPIGQGFDTIDQGFGPGFGPIGQGFDTIDQGFGPVDPVHNIAKAGTHMGLSSLRGLGKPLGGSPIHNVHKVGKSGVVAANHDPLAADIGHQTAKHIANKATHTINIATGGGVHRGDPFATNAAHGLAREAAAVTNEELALASGGARHFGPSVGIQPGLSIHGRRPVPILPKKKPVIQPFPTGYGRQRTRKVVAARAW